MWQSLLFSQLIKNNLSNRCGIAQWKCRNLFWYSTSVKKGITNQKNRLNWCPQGVTPLTKKPEDSGYEIALAQARVPGKAISANRRLHLPNHGINFIPRLDFVPESTININLEINRLARSIKSLIGGNVCKNKQNGRPTVATNITNTWKKRSNSKKLISTNSLTKSFAVDQVWPNLNGTFGRSPQERPRVTEEEKAGKKISCCQRGYYFM